VKTASFCFEVCGQDFISAGEAAMQVKRALRQMGYDGDLIRRVSVAMYEGEINMVLHADGGVAEIEIAPEEVRVTLTDRGPGIPDVELALREGYSTATDSIRSLGFGAGMGLPNMKRFADELTVSSELGVGTRIEMKFKIVKGEKR